MAHSRRIVRKIRAHTRLGASAATATTATATAAVAHTKASVREVSHAHRSGRARRLIVVSVRVSRLHQSLASRAIPDGEGSSKTSGKKNVFALEERGGDGLFGMMMKNETVCWGDGENGGGFRGCLFFTTRKVSRLDLAYRFISFISPQPVG